ncbi:MAG: M20/M25/M40 family metallo-hydrolase [Bacteroidales bacterium]|nr:M20/M25/M40 family metallo-hydrolase [Bacteroidales bacterium]
MTQDIAYYQAIDLLKQMIATPSTSRDETAVADILESYLKKESGLEVRRLGNNVWVVAPDFNPSRKTLLLNSHCDTVKPSATWTKDPFAPIEETVENAQGKVETRLYGLGSNDAGASLVSLLHVFLMLKDSPQKYNLVFLASCEEEVSGANGIDAVLKHWESEAENTNISLLPDLAIVGEPTCMRAAVAEKGLLVLDGVAHGKAGHAARNEGINALYIALDAIQKLRYYKFEKESPTLGPVKITVSVINGGTVHNVVPDECKFVVDVRSTDAYTNEETLKTLQELIAPVELSPRRMKLHSSGIPETHPLVERVKMLEIETFGSPTLSDQALLSCQSIKMGPGDSARSHTADEYICLDEIREAISIYYTLLNGLSF